MSDDPNELDPTELPSTEAAPSRSYEHQQIGPYHLLQKLGEGGMGEVWLAEQTEPVKRRVALKIIKQGMDTKQVVARFEAERQALAMMDHPTVAKVFDAGTTPRGRPFFVMEYVKGVPITEHCDRHKLTTRERLKLFCEVCEGVQHAHQKAIIHRDLKPSNVLVTEQDGKRLPKIIDFGVAKATAHKLTEKTVYTELGVLIGTPEYMSPEQAELTGEDVDTRTDVYSLGVMLYELLVGALPFDSKKLRSGGYEGIRKKIREEEPPRPSTRLSTLGEKSTESARYRRVDLPTLKRQVKGDLDWITMKALEKDRSRRYGSPTDLAVDIGRYLTDKPVLACPPTAAYRARKFWRRHRAGVLAATAANLVLIGFVATVGFQARRIAAERDASEQVSAFLADMLGNLDPQMLGRTLWEDLQSRVAEDQRNHGTSEDEIEAVLSSLADVLSGVNATDTALRLVDDQILSPAGTTIEQELKQQPRIAGRLEHILGSTYERLGLNDRARQHFARAAEIRQNALGAEHRDTLASKSRMGALLWYRGNHDAAEALLHETAKTQERVLGRKHGDTLWTYGQLAWVYYQQGRAEESAALRKEVLEGQREVLGEAHPQTLRSMNGLSGAYFGLGRYAEAEQLMREAVAIQRRERDNTHPDTLGSMLNLGIIVGVQGRHDEAEVILIEVVQGRGDVLGDEHPKTVNARVSLAETVAAQGRFAEAVEIGLETLSIARRVLNEDNKFRIGAMESLAAGLIGAGRFAEADELLREEADILIRTRGAGHPSTVYAYYSLGRVKALRKDPEAAAEWLRRAVENGWAEPNEMETEPAFEVLHGPKFAALVEQAQRNATAQQQD